MTGRSSSVVARFEVCYTRYLDAEGKPTGPLPAFAQDAGNLVPDYRAMVLMRAFDAKAVAMQRTGQIGTYASTLGREAIDAGLGAVMVKDDVLLPSYRESGILMLRGVSPHRTLLYWGGDERGSCFGAAPHDFPNCVPIGTQLCHAAGAAYAFRLRGEARAAVAIVGDGGTSKGDFYEAMNMAGVWQAPLVIVVNDNQWAISVPRERQSAAQTLAQKAIAAGIEGRQIDGNDVIAMHDAARTALAKARRGGGPTLIEALTYRLGDHTTADDATRYRDPELVAQMWQAEPIARLRKYLLALGAWDKAREEQLVQDCQRSVEAAVQAYLAVEPPDVSAMFDHLYATLPHSLDEQLAMARQFAGGQENGHG